MSEGRVLEAVSRVMAALDRLERRVEALSEALDSLAITIYLQCLADHVGGFERVSRLGVPAGLSFIAWGRDGVVYAGRARVVCTYEDAEWILSRAPSVAGLVGATDVVPLLVCSRYKGPEPPQGVRVVLC